MYKTVIHGTVNSQLTATCPRNRRETCLNNGSTLTKTNITPAATIKYSVSDHHSGSHALYNASSILLARAKKSMARSSPNIIPKTVAAAFR